MHMSMKCGRLCCEAWLRGTVVVAHRHRLGIQRFRARRVRAEVTMLLLGHIVLLEAARVHELVSAVGPDGRVRRAPAHGVLLLVLHVRRQGRVRKLCGRAPLRAGRQGRGRVRVEVLHVVLAVQLLQQRAVAPVTLGREEGAGVTTVVASPHCRALDRVRDRLVLHPVGVLVVRVGEDGVRLERVKVDGRLDVLGKGVLERERVARRRCLRKRGVRSHGHCVKKRGFHGRDKTRREGGFGLWGRRRARGRKYRVRRREK